MTYEHRCTITIKEKYTKENHVTATRDKVLLENEPCRISFSSINTTEENSNAARIVQTVKLFIAPEHNIPNGSKITINHDGIESLFSKSGKSALYPTHQEIMLDIFKDYA